MQGSRLTFLLTSLVASDIFDFTSQNLFFTSQNYQAWFCNFGGGSLQSSLALLSLSLKISCSIFLVFATFLLHWQNTLRYIHKNCITSNTIIIVTCRFLIHMGFALEVTLMDVNLLHLLFRN